MITFVIVHLKLAVRIVLENSAIEVKSGKTFMKVRTSAMKA